MLARCPGLYRAALRLAGSQNFEKAAFLRLIRRGQTVLDIGANRGDFTLLFSDLVGPSGQVHAFEPVPPTFALLERHIAASARHPNVRLNRFGLAAQAGSFPIHVPNSDLGQASLQRHSAASWQHSSVETFPCELRRLDDYASQLARLDFAKIDVEGAELSVLQGGCATLGRFAPVLHLEYFGEWTRAFGYAAGDLVSALQSLGYRCFYTGLLAPLQPERLGDSADPQNFVAAKAPLPL